jgi:hypothetical protein
MIRFALAIAIATLTVVGPYAAGAQDSTMSPASPPAMTTRWVRVEMSDGIAFELPEDWELSDATSNEHKYLWGRKIMRLADLPDAPGGVLLHAFPVAGEKVASVTVSIIRRRSATQHAVADLEGAALEQVLEQYRQDLLAAMRAEGAPMLEWHGGRKVAIKSIQSLVSNYVYQTAEKGPMLMESHRIFLGGANVGFMLQASVESEALWWPILQRVRQSFEARELP